MPQNNMNLTVRRIRNLIIGVFLLGMLLGYGCNSSNDRLTQPGPTADTMAALGSPKGTPGELNVSGQQALIAAIQDEYKARAVYQKVLKTFGNVQPFSQIVLSESQHVRALTTLFTRYGIAVPKDTWYDKVPKYDSLQEACEAGVQAEIDNVALYDKLFKSVNEPDIIRVFTKLRNASQKSHLPAFERCAQGDPLPDGTAVCEPGSGPGPVSGPGNGPKR